VGVAWFTRIHLRDYGHRGARQSYLKRVSAQALGGQALTCLSVIVPLAVAHPPAAVIGACRYRRLSRDGRRP